MYDLPSSARQLPEGVPQADDLPGKPHRYFFKLYALDKRLDLGAGATRKAVEQAMKGHILARAKLVGRYGR